MKKFLKIILVIFIIISAIITMVIASVPLWFPFERVKAYVIQEASEMTGREITINEIGFNILRGFEIKGFEMKESAKFGKKTFIKDEYITLNYNLLALLKKNIVINSFELHKPYIQIIKDKDGKFNFSDIIETMNKRKAEKAAKVKKQPAQKEAAGSAKKKTDISKYIDNIIVTSVKITGANLIYRDNSKPKPVDLKVENFNFKLDDLVLSAVKPVRLSSDSKIFFNGYNIPFLLQAEAKTELSKMQLNINIKRLAIGGIESTGTVDIAGLDNIKGRINSVSNTKKMLEVLPEDLSQKIKDVNAEIDINNDVAFALASKKFSFNNTLKISNGTLIYKDKKFVEQLGGTVKVNSTYNASGKLEMLLAGSKVNIDFTGENVNNPLESTVNVNISSPRFAIEYLLALFPKKEKQKDKPKLTQEELRAKKKASTAKTTAALRSAKGKKLPGIYLAISAGSVAYKTLQTGRANLNIRLIENKLYSETAVNFYSGTINNNLTADINKETYSNNTSIRGVEVNKFIDDAIAVMPKKLDKDGKEAKTILNEIQNKVYGSLHMNSDFNGATFANIPHTIKGSGKFDIKNGRLTAVNIGKDLARQIGAEFLGRDIPFDTMKADFAMAEGKIDIKNLSIMHGPNGEKGDIRIRGAGYVTVDNALDFRLITDINPREAKNIERFIAGSLGIRDFGFAYSPDGWMPLDFRIYNTIYNKKYDFAQDRMLQNVSRNLQKKAVEEGSRLLQKHGEELLKNLFKR